MKREKLIEKLENIVEVSNVDLHPYAIQLIADLIEEIVEGIRGVVRDRRKK